MTEQGIDFSIGWRKKTNTKGVNARMKRLWPIGMFLVLVVALAIGFSFGGHPTAARTRALATPHRSRRVAQTHGAQAPSLFVPV